MHIFWLEMAGGVIGVGLLLVDLLGCQPFTLTHTFFRGKNPHPIPSLDWFHVLKRKLDTSLGWLA